MNKGLKITLIVVGAILAIIIGLGTYLIINVSDNTNNTKTDVINRDISLEEFLNTKLTTSLKDANIKDSLDVLLSEEDMNTLAYALCKGINVKGLNILGTYCKYEDDGIYLEIPVKYVGVQTCLKVKLKITFEDSKLKLDIKEARLGNLDSSSWLIRTFVLTKSLQSNIVSSLREEGIFVSLDLKDLSATISTKEIVDTINNVFKNDPNAKLFSFIADFCLNNEDTIKFVFGQDNLYGVKINTSLMGYSAVRDGDLNGTIDFSGAKAKTLNLLGDKVNYSNVSVVYNYYANGYEALDEESKKVIDDLGLSKDEKGLKPETVITVFDLLFAQRNNHSTSIIDLLTNIQLISLTDKQVDSVFTFLDFVGFSIAFTDGSDIAYITLEELDVFFDNNFMAVNLIVNLNGKRLVAHIDSNVPDNKLTKITAEITNLRLGEKELSGRYSTELMDYLVDILEGEKWITPDSSSMTITMDLKEILSQIKELSRLLNICNSTSTRVRRTTNGYIEIVLNPFG